MQLCILSSRVRVFHVSAHCLTVSCGVFYIFQLPLCNAVPNLLIRTVSNCKALTKQLVLLTVPYKLSKLHYILTFYVSNQHINFLFIIVKFTNSNCTSSLHCVLLFRSFSDIPRTLIIFISVLVRNLIRHAFLMLYIIITS